MTLLATEGCSCPGAASDVNKAWLRAERVAHDVLYDINAYAQGWIDWNLLVDSEGGPNHENNFCDAAFTVADKEYSSLTIQPKYYYMGHISKFITPNSVRIGSAVIGDYGYESVDPAVVGGLEVGLYPCEQSTRQMWSINDLGNIVLSFYNFDVDNDDGTNVFSDPHFNELCMTIPTKRGTYGTGRDFVAIAECANGYLIEAGGWGDQNALIVVDESYGIEGMYKDKVTGKCLTMIVNQDLDGYVGSSGSLLQLLECDSTNSLQFFASPAVSDLPPSVYPHIYVGKPFELLPLDFQEVSRLISGFTANIPPVSLCATAGWPFLYGSSVLRPDGTQAIVAVNEASIEVSVQYTDDGVTQLSFGIGPKSMISFTAK